MGFEIKNVKKGKKLRVKRQIPELPQKASSYDRKKSPSMISNFTPFTVRERCELASSETT